MDPISADQVAAIKKTIDNRFSEAFGLLKGGEIHSSTTLSLDDIDEALRIGRAPEVSAFGYSTRPIILPAGVTCDQCGVAVTDLKPWGVVAPCGHMGDLRKLTVAVQRREAVEELRSIAERSLNEG